MKSVFRTTLRVPNFTALFDGAQQRKQRGSAHDVAHTLAINQARHYATFKVNLDLFGAGLRLRIMSRCAPLIMPPKGVCMAR
jgi:hypothetical protein